MTVPRAWVAPVGTMGTFHVISRCTRRLWLLHGEWAHRKDWVCELAGDLLGHFRIDLHAYAIMANHVHLVLRPRPDLVAGMAAVAVAEAGHRAMPVRGGHGNTALPMTPDLLLHLAGATAWQVEYRQRLASISWFMRCLKQRISLRANGESGCTGHFWDARFISTPLPDLGAVVGCMAYIDANPFRATVVKKPEDGAYASLRARVRPEELRGTAEALLAVHLTPLGEVAPVDQLSGRMDGCDLDLASYLQLVRCGCGLASPGADGCAAVRQAVETELGAWRRCVTAAGMYQ